MRKGGAVKRRKGGRTEQGTLGDLNGLAEASHRQVDQTAILLLLRVQELHQQRCQWAAKVRRWTTVNSTRREDASWSRVSVRASRE